ncbi:hypothetical protein HYS91_01175 [Candidatus Daviesbacteria bacterium]|nr:hypothetical protein [Candidatus Daviesbacteria bacterium]
MPKKLLLSSQTFISLFIFAIVTVFYLNFPCLVLAQDASPSASPSPSPVQGSVSPSPSATPTPDPSASPSPSANPAASPSPSPSPSASAKPEVLGATKVLGATGAQIEVVKWILVFGVLIIAILLGLKIVRSKTEE